jgi:uncharacterized membrane protein
MEIKLGLQRGFYKMITYRIGSFLITVALAFILTGSASFAGLFAFWELIVSSMWYLSHELWWHKKFPENGF